MPLAHLNGTELFYIEVGEGTPCLMMHGGLGFDHTSLHPWFDPLSDVMRLVYYDHRANGRSGRPPLKTLTFEWLCADADALREHLGFEEVTVLGHSYGGFIALEYALRYPERLGRLILLAFAFGLERWSVVPRLGEVSVPTLILVGRDDFICPPSQAKIMHEGIPHSELVVFERSGHFPYIEEPEAFFDAVRGWLQRT